tara:strand:+ start:26115 stop:26711 length:597 start_codon:yes stop_codon:yes gene_type:complete
MIKIGLTGSIATGKSTVLSIFKKNFNLPVFSSDECVKELYESEDKLINFVKQKILKSNKDVFSNKDIANIIFYNDEKRIQLEEFIHPLVKVKRDKYIEAQKQKNTKYVVLEIPLLFEKDIQKELDVTLLVRTSLGLQRERALGREGMTKKLFENILNKQMPNDIKEKKADYIIDNYDYQKTVNQVHDILNQIQKRKYA